ncbi:MAG TPA: tricarboxylate transporter, partial [Oceanospirillaceae bacterium]|nr:tricarboxylate transporter [Oceanospirillaceae bacterium]
IGLVLSAVGFDIISGEPRLVLWDIIGFMHGVNFLVLAIGIYGIGEMLWTVEEHVLGGGKSMMSEANVTVKRTITNIKLLAKTWKATIMGSFLGYFVGILPAAGATPGSLMAYGIAKQISKEP